MSVDIFWKYKPPYMRLPPHMNGPNFFIICVNNSHSSIKEDRNYLVYQPGDGSKNLIKGSEYEKFIQNLNTEAYSYFAKDDGNIRCQHVSSDLWLAKIKDNRIVAIGNLSGDSTIKNFDPLGKLNREIRRKFSHITEYSILFSLEKEGARTKMCFYEISHIDDVNMIPYGINKKLVECDILLKNSEWVNEDKLFYSGDPIFKNTVLVNKDAKRICDFEALKNADSEFRVHFDF